MIALRVNDPSVWKIKPEPTGLRGQVVRLVQTLDGKSCDEFLMRCRALPDFKSTGESPNTWLKWLQKQNVVWLAS